MRRLLTSYQSPVQSSRLAHRWAPQARCAVAGNPAQSSSSESCGSQVGSHHRPTRGYMEPYLSIRYSRLKLVSSYSEPHRPTVRVCFASRGSGVQISSAPPETRRSEHGSGFSLIIWRARTGSQVVKFQAWRRPNVAAMAKTASTSTTEPNAGIASSTRAVRAAGVASYRSASARTGSGSARRSAAKPGPRSRKAQDAALGAGCGRPDRIGLHGRQGSGRLARRGPCGPYREDGRGQ
jgi:hypothetical protein